MTGVTGRFSSCEGSNQTSGFLEEPAPPFPGETVLRASYGSSPIAPLKPPGNALKSQMRSSGFGQSNEMSIAGHRLSRNPAFLYTA